MHGGERDFMDASIQKSLEGLLEESYKAHVALIDAAKKRLKKTPGNN